MTKTVVLGFSGGVRSAAAVSWLAKHHQAEVVTVTLNLGQSGDMAEMREHALAAGAVRAHVLDKRQPDEQGFEFHSGKNPHFLSMEEILGFNHLAGVK